MEGRRLPDDTSVALQGRAHFPTAVLPLIQVDPLVALKRNKAKKAAGSTAGYTLSHRSARGRAGDAM